MVAPRQEHCYYSCCKYPPFLAALAEDETEHEEEDGDGSHIHRTRGERLRSPVERHLFQGLAKVRLTVSFKEFSCLRIHIQLTSRRSSVEVRNEEVWHFIDTVRPCCGIVKVKTFGVMAVAVGGKFRAASHGVWSVLVCRDEFVGVGCDTDASDDQKQCRGCEEIPELCLLVLPYVDQQRDCIYEYYNGKVICDLDVVCLDLHAEGECEENSSEDGLRQPFLAGECRPVCEYDSGENPREEGDRLHLCVVADLDDLHVVCAEGNGDSSCDCKHLAHSHRDHQKESSKEGYKEVASRTLSEHDEFVERFCPVSFKVVCNSGGRHSSEHRSGPCGRIVRVRLIMFKGFMRHSFPSRDIALINDLSVQYLRYETVCYSRQKEYDTRISENVLK